MQDHAQEDIIHLLPDSVANQIAAGEVIQRPASVIKELVENSIDAGAGSVEIVVKDAGKTLVQVIDDGKGMSATDARMAFERHATSKIRQADDLFSLHTMGFRGEALPSIAAVSEIEMTSRRPGDELGTKIVIRASKVESQEPTMTLQGTNIKVKSLFYNFVARRRFLKKDSVELGHIAHEFERLALVNHKVGFKFISNGVVLHSLPKSTLKERIKALFGKAIGDTVIPVDVETSLVKINGFISLPSGSRQRGLRQFLFVNGRNMRHPYFHKAILSCYDNLIAKDAQPHYFINFEVAPDRIDVNIHPQKHEIKFEDEQAVWQILTAAIRESLGRHNAMTPIDFNTAGAPDIPPMTGDKSRFGVSNDIEEGVNPFVPVTDASVGQNRLDFGHYADFPVRDVARPSQRNNIRGNFDDKQNVSGWEDFYKALESEKREENTANNSVDTLEFKDGEADKRHNLFQVRDKYIVTETTESLLIIDQHRAHVNILYNDFLNEVKSATVASQSLLFREPLDLDTSQTIMLESAMDLIERIGFRVEKTDGSGYMLTGMPGVLGSKNPVEVLKNILTDLSDTGIDVEADALKRVLLTMARSAAITAGRRLAEPEMEHIVASLFRLSSPGYTPDGLSVICRLTDGRLENMFK